MLWATLSRPNATSLNKKAHMASNVETIDNVVIRFAGDSGDGMQLTGTQFTNTSAIQGNDLATFPDFPAEIRAPAGTVAGVSGFQLHFSSRDIRTPGDEPHILIAMNPAALKANIGALKSGGTVIVNTDKFTDRDLEKADYTSNPLEDGTLEGFQVVPTASTGVAARPLRSSGPRRSISARPPSAACRSSASGSRWPSSTATRAPCSLSARSRSARAAAR